MLSVKDIVVIFESSVFSKLLLRPLKPVDEVEDF